MNYNKIVRNTPFTRFAMTLNCLSPNGSVPVDITEPIQLIANMMEDQHRFLVRLDLPRQCGKTIAALVLLAYQDNYYNQNYIVCPRAFDMERAISDFLKINPDIRWSISRNRINNVDVRGFRPFNHMVFDEFTYYREELVFKNLWDRTIPYEGLKIAFSSAEENLSAI